VRRAGAATDRGRAQRDARVSATCDGEPVPLAPWATGAWSYRFPSPPPEGTVCEVTIDGIAYALPPLPAPPDASYRWGRLQWTPGGGDEIRVAAPRSAGRGLLCRLPDEGAASTPALGALAFTSRHRLGLPEMPDGARLSITITAGAWWRR